MGAPGPQGPQGQRGQKGQRGSEGIPGVPGIKGDVVSNIQSHNTHTHTQSWTRWLHCECINVVTKTRPESILFAMYVLLWLLSSWGSSWTCWPSRSSRIRWLRRNQRRSRTRWPSRTKWCNRTTSKKNGLALAHRNPVGLEVQWISIIQWRPQWRQT